MFSLKRFSAFLIGYALMQMSLLLFYSCKGNYRNKSHANVSIASIEQGEDLAAKYCSSCHSLPSPAWLDAATWEKGVLPNMGPRLGIYEHRFQDYPSYKNDRYLERNTYPSQPLLTAAQWQNIIDYYTATSPDTLARQSREQQIELGLRLFTVQTPAVSYTNATTSFIKMAPGGISYPLVVSDALKKTTYFFNQALSVEDSFTTSGPTVDIDFAPMGLVACNNQ